MDLKAEKHKPVVLYRQQRRAAEVRCIFRFQLTDSQSSWWFGIIACSLFSKVVTAVMEIFSGQFGMDAQQFVVEKLLRDAVTIMYPPAASYISHFIRLCLRAAEDQHHELYEGLLDAYMSSMELTKACPHFTFLHGNVAQT